MEPHSSQTPDVEEEREMTLMLFHNLKELRRSAREECRDYAERVIEYATLIDLARQRCVLAARVDVAHVDAMIVDALSSLDLLTQTHAERVSILNRLSVNMMKEKCT
jgi:hypothetical protein